MGTQSDLVPVPSSALTCGPHGPRRGRDQSDLVPVPSSALTALRAKAALADVPVWRPDEGETLEGVITSHRQTQNPFGAMQSQMIVKTFDGRTVAVWLSQWALNELRGQGASMGDLVSISYHGLARSKRGTSYGRYSIATMKA